MIDDAYIRSLDAEGLASLRDSAMRMRASDEGRTDRDFRWMCDSIIVRVDRRRLKLADAARPPDPELELESKPRARPRPQPKGNENARAS